ncbi:tRNA pseudouridine(13) synthase TruD [Thiohalomonas denitrificans]|uniref:tRNA pseudouridine synthase D n=1 Tax=Thiohalomonas denitrificans TaxID=415747 RepID=A0A1G5Q2L8_9GAMM|nr:tRNA pseudouridine(13) synthase TruD [Thiohalomonas denitrificans]SCZ56063.1 tRNA pseudouridine13 synthase [Thiohalomonas denitrificans]
MTSWPMEWAFAHGGPAGTGVIRTAPEDFRVDEIPLVTPDGAGEHVLLHVEKRGANTDFVARLLTRLAGVRPVDVSFAGMKDRHAVTTQWFSVRLGGSDEPDWSALESDEVRILDSIRHGRKLRRGALKGNRFSLVVREVEADRGELQERLEIIKAQGVPNYFGPQRFGRGAGNLDRAEALFRGEFRERNRTKRGLYLSAARSWLFNRVLSERVLTNTWNRPLTGEVLMLDGRSAVFPGEADDSALPGRVGAGEIHPTGPLWGEGHRMPAEDALRLEDQVLTGLDSFKEGLEAARLKQERRALRLPVRHLEWNLQTDTLEIAFQLDPGTYATTVLRELLEVE